MSNLHGGTIQSDPPHGPDDTIINPPGRPTRRGLAGTVRHSGWTPGLALLTLTIGVLALYDVPIGTSLLFAGYVAAGVTLPGTLLWRALRGRPGVFVADVAAGTAVGYAGEVLTYIAARYVGAPLLVLAFPVLTVAAFVAVPRLRPFWRASRDPGDRAPVWFAWSLVGVLTLMLAWACLRWFRITGLRWPDIGAVDDDSMFHLALIGEAKHHMPLETPWVSGEPVLYHWFVYADMAATSWVTGIEPQVLLMRLYWIPLVAAFTGLIAMIARRLTKTWWAGVVAAAATFFLLAPNPYPFDLDGWFTSFATSPFEDGSTFRLILWTSPTFTFGMTIFAALVYVLIEVLTGRAGAGRWALFGILAVAVMGGKATFLPVLFCGLVLTIALEFVQRRQLHRPALIASVVTLVCLAFAQVVLFGGASGGLALQPLQIMQISGAPMTAHLTIGEYDGDSVGAWPFVLSLLLTLYCWVSMWAAIGGLAARRQSLRPIVVLLGIGLGGAGAILLLGEPGGAAAWFFNAVRPYLCIAAVAGFAALLARTEVRRRGWVLLGGAVVAGMAVVYLVRTVTPFLNDEVPDARNYGRVGAAFWVAAPYVVIAATVVGVAVYLRRRHERLGIARGMVPVLVIAMLAGTAFYSPIGMVKDAAEDAVAEGFRTPLRPPMYAYGTVEAGRWIRDHSAPDDLVAANGHCYFNLFDPCDARHFSVAAYTERRVLVEGWSFTSRAHEEAHRLNALVSYVPYWRPEVLEANDRVFYEPSAEAVATLRDQYGVRWLFVDTTVRQPAENLGDFARLVYEYGDCAVYELPPRG